MNLEPLAQYGLVGICLGLILLIAFIIQATFKIVGNHIKHTSDAINKNTEVLTKTEETIKNGTEASKENIQVTRELKEYLIMSNGGNKRGVRHG